MGKVTSGFDKGECMRMTQKRFNRVGGYVYDGDKCISHFEDVSHRDEIVTLLNELHEENKQLKLDKQHLHQAMSREEVRHKQFKDKVFDLIDKSLEKDKQYYEMTYEDYLNGRIEVLEELKKAMME